MKYYKSYQKTLHVRKENYRKTSSDESRFYIFFTILLFSYFQYADPVADLLDKWDVFHCRLFRESCVFHRGNYVKDLGRLGRELHNIIIVDNSPASYIFHPDNAVRPKKSASSKNHGTTNEVYWSRQQEITWEPMKKCLFEIWPGGMVYGRLEPLAGI